jgi:phosphoserine phosphatase
VSDPSSPLSPDEEETLRVSISGDDRPGVTSALFDAIAGVGAEVRDLEQVVVRGQLTLAMLLAAGPDTDRLEEVVRGTAHSLDLKVKARRGTGDNAPRRSGRAAVVVIGAPLTAAAVASVAARIAAHGANIDRIRRLSRYPVTTVELDVSGSDIPRLRRELALEAAEQGVDIAVSAGGLDRRGRRLVVMDVDSTLIQQEVIELLAARCGRGEEVAAVTERAMRGELDFAESLRARVRVLAGLDARVLEEVRREVVLTPGARTLVRTLKRLGFMVAVVSGGFIEIVGPLAAELGIDRAEANRLEIQDGRLTGNMVGDIVDRAG